MNNPKRVLFEVFGSPGSVATINFLDEHAQPQRVDDAPLPWSHTVTTDDPTLFADLHAQGDAANITCRITVNGIAVHRGPSRQLVLVAVERAYSPGQSDAAALRFWHLRSTTAFA